MFGSSVGLVGRPRDTTGLHSALAAIYGADLIGLWIGEDLVVDGSNNVTSWPGRVGGTLTPANASYLNTRRLDNNKLSVYRVAESVGDSGLITTINASTTPKSVWTVCRGPAAGLGGSYKTLTEFIGGTGEYPLVRDTAVDTWYSGGWTHYQNGVATETRVAEQAIYEAVKASPATNNTTFRVTCEPTAPSGAWIWGAWFVMNLSAIPTTLQRLQTQLALDTYYRPAQAPAAKLALDLYNLFGADLIGLWVGEDVVVSGTDVTSWPSRVGPTLTLISGAEYVTTGTLNSRTSTYNSSTHGVGLNATLPAATKSLITVLDIDAYPAGVGNYTQVGCFPGAENALSIESDTHNWAVSTGFFHYVNGVATEVASLGPQIVEGVDATCTATGIQVLGRGTGAFVAQDLIGSMGMFLALSAVPSAGNRAASVTLLRAYYGI